MKILTLTCHDVYNHGAALQAYALQTYLKAQGHEVEIIDYKPAYLNGHYRLFRIANPKWKNNLLTRVVYLAVKIPGRIMQVSSLLRKLSFDRFNKKHLNITAKCYESNDQLLTDCPEGDVYICGSDQIWNTLHDTGRDPAFYLDFVPDGKFKFSYAASMATDEIYGGLSEFVKSKVSKLTAISLREKSGVEILERLGLGGLLHVMDPVFLLDRKHWDTLLEDECENTYKQDYILVYDFENSTFIREAALALAKQKNCKIYSVNPGQLDYVDKRFDNAGPEVFVSLIRSAHAVVSNSFHAIVFSMIYETPFVVVKRDGPINTRMKDLLETLLFDFDLDEFQILEMNDNNKKNLEIKINNSKSFISSCLELANN